LRRQQHFTSERVCKAQLAAFSADGTRVVTASFSRGARVWDARTGEPVGAPLEHQDFVVSAAFSADGTRVVTASYDLTARVWDARTGQPVGAPLQHQGPVESAAFSADGMRVVTASYDRTARVWDTMTGNPSDAGLIAEAAEALSGLTANDAGGLVRIADARARVTRLRQNAATMGSQTVLSALQWLFEDPWTRTISPLSDIRVETYIAERLKQCTRMARAEAQSYFFGHPLLLRIREFCPDAASSDIDISILTPLKSSR
jgi:WD40 repeat protein